MGRPEISPPRSRVDATPSKRLPRCSRAPGGVFEQHGEARMEPPAVPPVRPRIRICLPFRRAPSITAGVEDQLLAPMAAAAHIPGGTPRWDLARITGSPRRGYQ